MIPNYLCRCWLVPFALKNKFTYRPVHIDPLDSESELVMRTMETTYCTGNNCNKDKMAEISYSGANINHSVTALVIMACMALLR